LTGIDAVENGRRALQPFPECCAVYLNDLRLLGYG
jgi:hypothetical protein